MRLRIVQPCREDWDAMHPTERGRFCDVCASEVHDLSVLTERQARRLLAARAGQRTCVRARLRADGRAVFRSEPPRVVPAAAALALVACAPHSPEPGRLAASEEIEHAAPPVPRTVEIPEAPPQVAAKREPPPPKPPKAKPRPRIDDEMIDVGYLEAWD